MLEVWQWSRGGAMGGPGYLPEAGGPLDQAARNMDILAVANAAAAWCERHIPAERERPAAPAARRR